MEGMFAFFLESAFVGVLIWGEKRLGPRIPFPGVHCGCIGELAFRLLHSCHERLHAISGRLPGRSRWRAWDCQPLRVFVESLGLVQFCP